MHLENSSGIPGDDFNRFHVWLKFQCLRWLPDCPFFSSFFLEQLRNKMSKPGAVHGKGGHVVTQGLPERDEHEISKLFFIQKRERDSCFSTRWNESSRLSKSLYVNLPAVPVTGPFSDCPPEFLHSSSTVCSSLSLLLLLFAVKAWEAALVNSNIRLQSF